MAKLNRENKLRERKLEKAARKAARKLEEVDRAPRDDLNESQPVASEE